MTASDTMKITVEDALAQAADALRSAQTDWALTESAVAQADAWMRLANLIDDLAPGETPDTLVGFR